jgi:hypothetical protein
MHGYGTTSRGDANNGTKALIWKRRPIFSHKKPRVGVPRARPVQRRNYVDIARGEFGDDVIIIILSPVFFEPARDDDLVIIFAENAHARP